MAQSSSLSGSLSMSISDTGLRLEHTENTLVSHGVSSEKFSMSMSTPDVKDVLLGQVLGDIVSSWTSNLLARNFAEHMATRAHQSSPYDRSKRHVHNRPFSFKVAFHALKSQLEEYQTKTSLILEENKRLKNDNTSLHNTLTAARLRVQELECSLSVETTQHQADTRLHQTDKERISRLNQHVVQLQRFIQSLVSLDFKQHPVVDHASQDVLNGSNSDNALIDAILEAAAQEDSPWSRIYSSILSSRPSPQGRSLKHYSLSSEASGDTASTTSSKAYRHDAPPVLNNILADLKAGLFPSKRGVIGPSSVVAQPSSASHSPISPQASQDALWADPSHVVESIPITDPKSLPAPGTFVASVLPVDLMEDGVKEVENPFEPQAICDISNYDHGSDIENYVTANVSLEPTDVPPVTPPPLPVQATGITPLIRSKTLPLHVTHKGPRPSKPYHTISSKLYNKSPTKVPLQACDQNVAAMHRVEASVGHSAPLNCPEEKAPITLDSALAVSRAKSTAPSNLKLSEQAAPRLLSPLKLNMDGKKTKSPSPSSSVIQDSTSDASPHTSPSSLAPSSPNFRHRIFTSRTLKKPTSPGLSARNSRLASPPRGETNVPSSSCPLRKRFGGPGKSKKPRLKLHDAEKPAPLVSETPSPQYLAEIPSVLAKAGQALSPASASFGTRTRKLSQITANFMSSVESMIQSSKPSSPSTSSPPSLSPQLAAWEHLDGAASVSSSPMSSVVSSPSPSPNLPYTSEFQTISVPNSTVSPSTPPPSRPLPPVPMVPGPGRAPKSRGSPSAPQPPKHLSHTPNDADVDVPEALNTMQFPIKWERYEPKPLDAGFFNSESTPMLKIGRSNTINTSHPVTGDRKSDIQANLKPNASLRQTVNALAPVDTNRPSDKVSSSRAQRANSAYRSSYPPLSLERTLRSSDGERANNIMHTDVVSDDATSKSDSSPNARKLKITSPSARELGKRKGLFLGETASALLGLPVAQDMSNLGTTPIVGNVDQKLDRVKDVGDTPPEHERERYQQVSIDYKDRSTLVGLDISAENIDRTVGRLVSSFSSSSLGSLDASSESDHDRLKPRNKGSRYKVKEGLRQATEKDVLESLDLEQPIPPPPGLTDITSSRSPAKAVTWGGISVQNISSSETSSLASSSSSESITSPSSEDLSTPNPGKALSQLPPTLRDLEKNPPLVSRLKKSLSISVKSSTVPISILKKSPLPNSLITATEMKVPIRPARESSPPLVNTALSSLEPDVDLSSASANALTVPLMCDKSLPASEFSSNSNFISVDSTQVSDATSTPSFAEGGLLDTPVADTALFPAAASVPKASTDTSHVTVSSRFAALTCNNVIARSTVGPTAKRLSSGSLAHKTSRLPATSLADTKPSLLPRTPQSSLQTKRNIPPGRQCPDTSRSFLAIPTRKSRSKTVSSPLPPALCTPSPESLLSSPPGKTRSNTVPYSPTTRSPLSQHVITAPASSDKLSSPPRSPTGTVTLILPHKQKDKAGDSPTHKGTGQRSASISTSRIARRTIPLQGGTDNQKSRYDAVSGIPTLSEQTSTPLTALQYRRLFRGPPNMAVR
ncbi:hypothetical protein CVT24_004580 [Panaeolus cyanescens]|uniref:Uncharacterized protein n=1 Tax=Panaeolus cyanescens TaxID=181874 RepID=A0A409VDB5_9AGAR|nr:hypothetical protein CVT24_004580 [Panaeolus cyanescens]